MGLCGRFCARIYEVYKNVFLKKLNVLFIGMGKSGKSTLVKAIFEGKYDESPPPHKSKVQKYVFNGVEFSIYDIPGGLESVNRWNYFYKKCDIVVFVFDSCSMAEESRCAKTELHNLLYRNMWEKKSLLVLGTKNDNSKAMDCKDIILTLDLARIYDREVACYSVSSKNLVNVNLVVPWLIDQLEQGL